MSCSCDHDVKGRWKAPRLDLSKLNVNDKIVTKKLEESFRDFVSLYPECALKYEIFLIGIIIRQTYDSTYCHQALIGTLNKKISLHLCKYLWNLFQKHFASKQYPRIFTTLIGLFAKYNHLWNGIDTLVTDTLWYMESRCNGIKSVYHENKSQWKLIDRMFYNDFPFIVTIIDSIEAVISLSCNNDNEKNLISTVGSSYLRPTSVRHDSLYSIYTLPKYFYAKLIKDVIIDELDMKIYPCTSNGPFYFKTSKTINDKMLSMITSMFDKIVYCELLLQKNMQSSTIKLDYDENHNYLTNNLIDWKAFWNFYILSQSSLNVKKLDCAFELLSKALDSSMIQLKIGLSIYSNEQWSKLQTYFDFVYCNIGRLLCYYFITGNWIKFNKYLKELQDFWFILAHVTSCGVKKLKFKIETMYHFVLCKCINRIVQNTNDTLYFHFLYYSSKSIEWRLSWIQCLYIAFCYDDEYKQRIRVGWKLETPFKWDDERYLQVLNNVMMYKECNWVNCTKKDIKLKRCKKCKSVYYCSKKCQKQDWNLKSDGNISHKNVCKAFQRRNLSICHAKM